MQATASYYLLHYFITTEELCASQ